jgi:hypothetical protein
VIEIRNLEVEARDSTLTVDLSYSIRRTNEQQSLTLSRPI